MTETYLINKDFDVLSADRIFTSIEPHDENATNVCLRPKEQRTLLNCYGNNFTLIESDAPSGESIILFRFLFKDDITVIEFIDEDKFDTVYEVHIYDGTLLKEKLLLNLLHPQPYFK